MTYEQLITEFKMICDNHPDCTGCQYDDVGDYWMCALVHGFIKGRECKIEEFESLLYQFGCYDSLSTKLTIYKEDLERLIEQLKEQK